MKVAVMTKFIVPLVALFAPAPTLAEERELGPYGYKNVGGEPYERCGRNGFCKPLFCKQKCEKIDFRCYEGFCQPPCGRRLERCCRPKDGSTPFCDDEGFECDKDKGSATLGFCVEDPSCQTTGDCGKSIPNSLFCFAFSSLVPHISFILYNH